MTENIYATRTADGSTLRVYRTQADRNHVRIHDADTRTLVVLTANEAYALASSLTSAVAASINDTGCLSDVLFIGESGRRLRVEAEYGEYIAFCLDEVYNVWVALTVDAADDLATILTAFYKTIEDAA